MWNKAMGFDSVDELSAPPQSKLTKEHSWSTAGSRTVTLTAKQDAHGRLLPHATVMRSVQVTPQALPEAQYVSQVVPSSMVAGQTYPVSVAMRNNGVTWTPGVYFLGSQNPADNTTWGVHRVSLPHPVAQGQEVTFTFNVIAPSTPGSYAFQWQMLQDGVGSFGHATPNVSITVTEPEPPPPGPTCPNFDAFCSQWGGQGCFGICEAESGFCECYGKCRGSLL